MDLLKAFDRYLIAVLFIVGPYLIIVYPIHKEARQRQAEAEKTAVFESCVQSLYRSILEDTSSNKRIPSRSEAEAICMQRDYR